MQEGGGFQRQLRTTHEEKEISPPKASQGNAGGVPPERAHRGWGGGVSHGWRALRHRNFRLFFSGQSVSLIGTWMTRLATSWLVYRLTGSALWLGVVGFAGQIPTFFLAAVAGVWVDRLNRRQVLVWTQGLAAVQSLALAALTLSHRITILEIVLLSIFQGLINAFDMPGRQAFLTEMVEGPDDLGNAIALNSTMVNLARLVGPSLAGLIIAGFGEGYCFLIDGMSYFAVIASLLAMRMNAAPLKRATASMVEQLKEGWAYVSGFAPVRTILLLFALASLMGMPYSVLMPIFASRVLHGGAHTLGFLMGAAGVGALISAISLALRKTVLGLGRMISIAFATFGGGLVLLGLSHVLWLSLLVMLPIGFGMMQGMASSNTIIQTVVPEDRRGRVMSYYTMAFVGMAPFGSLLAGALAHVLDAPRTVMITGSVLIVGSILFATRLKEIRRLIRPIYEAKGILPPSLTPAAEDIGGAAPM